MKFPKNFFWGASTSSHQVEGSNKNDWSEWEEKNAQRLAQQAEKKYKDTIPIWQIIKKQAQNPLNYISGKSIDHYHRFEEDFDLALSLSLNAYRFSIEWSRIEPRRGKFNLQELDHYQKLIQTLRKRKIEPFITLWHWSLPLWARDQGGWQSKATIQDFTHYTEKVVSFLAPHVKFWITINEPIIYASHSYLSGLWPPQKRNPLLFYLVIRNLIQAHQQVYPLIKKIDPQAQIGIAKNNIYFAAHPYKVFTLPLKILADYLWNFYFLNKIKDTQDFIGLNHYFYKPFHFSLKKNNDKIILNDLGWRLYPKAILYVLRDLRRYHKPIYITENGLADYQDKKRLWYLREILKKVSQALQEGIDVRGYFHWSLLDNFEWDKGFWPRFGLIAVDYQTLRRKIRKSGWEYAKIIKQAQ